MACEDGREEETDAPATDDGNHNPAQDVEREPYEDSAVEEQDR